MEEEEDDEGDWEPLVMVPAEEQEHEQEQAEATVIANAQEVLEAVDELLQSTAATSGSSGASSVSSSGSAAAAADDDNDDGDNDGNDDATIKIRNGGRRRRRESPLKIRRRLKAAKTKLQKSLDLQQHLVQPVARLSVSTTRKVVTGSKTTRVRDYVVLPRVVRVLDKYTFTFGVMGLLLTEYMALEYPSLFQYYFVAIMLPLLALRVVLFSRTKQQYFLLDYCYWVNGLGFALVLAPHLLPAADMDKYKEYMEIAWQVLFVSANGPLFFAMIAWNNSLVFHSVDKVTSTYVHLFPALLSLCERWRSPDALLHNPQLYLSTPSRHFGYPTLFYATWQLVYLIQTEWLHRDTLDADPDLSTSLRYLSSAEKMAINKATLKLCRSCRIMGRDETFSPPTLKVKFIFVILQAAMTVVTFSPVRLFYDSEVVHCGVVISILIFSL